MRRDREARVARQTAARQQALRPAPPAPLRLFPAGPCTLQISDKNDKVQIPYEYKKWLLERTIDWRNISPAFFQIGSECRGSVASCPELARARLPCSGHVFGTRVAVVCEKSMPLHRAARDLEHPAAGRRASAPHGGGSGQGVTRAPLRTATHARPPPPGGGGGGGHVC